MLKTYQYRIYPSKSQLRQLASVLETCRRWYNACLAECKTTYQERGEKVTKNDQLAKVKDLKATNPFASIVHSHILQTVVQDLHKAFEHFFRRVKAGQKPGYPRFKGRNRFHSFGFKEYNNGFKIDGRRLRVSGVGRIRVRWHRPIQGTIKTVRLVSKAGHWYACFACEVDAPSPLPPTGRDGGVDVGLHSLLMTSDGEATANPQWYRTAQCQLRILQRRVARRKKGSKNRQKAVVALQRQHAKIVNQRRDVLNKAIHRLITQYDRIAVEKLTISNMVKNRYLSKSILDAAWGYFRERLTSKAVEAGRVVFPVDPKDTSKTCSGCGKIFEELTLKERWIDCPRCGLSLDRDHNAALNILHRAGRVRWALSLAEAGLAQETPSLV